ncbi:hypothetical protein AAFN85_12015 [Mucilaginibacter sp. CAU 1740]|uniref:hypothetical protein n=1 Tax=Mucilaginibacter sp. CAU 1740 TaxID=3140365 RepID=UPI00325AAC49
MRSGIKTILKKKIIGILLPSIISITACSHKKTEVQTTNTQKQLAEGPTPYARLVNNEKERTRLWRAAIDSGDCNAYNKIAIAYLMTYKEVDLYYYSLIMANKYHCPEAYRNMNAILTHEASAGDIVMLSNDADTKNLANYYLFKAMELGSEQARNDIELEFGKGKHLPNSSFFLKKIMAH